jgi:hypothetical protein
MSALATADLSRCAVESKATAGARRAWLYPVLSCAAVLVCILLASPFNEAGFNDDWSYARVAMKLAETGRLQYNGWGSPILLFQSFWAAPWIRAFGFSMQVLQVSMIPVSLGFVALVYAAGRAMGLSRELSAFASIATGSSPLFLPLAASFMTDSPGCLFCMLCVYSALRGVQAANSRDATRWLWVLALAGVIGGANRQVVWIAPVVLVPYLLWVRRADSAFRIHAVAAYGASGITILAILHFLSQPYGPLQLSHEELLSVFRNGSGKAINLAASLIMVCVFAALPAFCCLLPLARRRWIVLSLIPLTIVTFGLVIFTGLAAPYGNGIFSWVGIATEGQEWFRTKPGTLAPWLRIVLSVATTLCVTVSASWLIGNRRALTASFKVFAVFCLGYLALLLPGILLGFAFDRYMLPILPLMMLVVLSQLVQFREHIPAVAWCCLGAFACYGIAATHDYSAALRARIAAAHGIDRARVSVGFEYDGWTELQRSEYVSVVQYADLFADDHAKGLWFWFWNHTPHLQPDFVVLNWNSPERAHGGETKVDFRAWMPPFERSAVVWRRSDLTGAFQAARMAALFR